MKPPPSVDDLDRFQNERPPSDNYGNVDSSGEVNHETDPSVGHTGYVIKTGGKIERVTSMPMTPAPPPPLSEPAPPSRQGSGGQTWSDVDSSGQYVTARPQEVTPYENTDGNGKGGPVFGVEPRQPKHKPQKSNSKNSGNSKNKKDNSEKDDSAVIYANTENTDSNNKKLYANQVGYYNLENKSASKTALDSVDEVVYEDN